jgi:uncharacterized iron-regulated membrane protein
VSPPTDTISSVFLVDANGKQIVVAVDPHDAKVLGTSVKDDSWFYWARAIHGSFMLGKPSNGFGDYAIEIAAGLGIVMIITGLYMWWPRNGKGFVGALVPSLGAKGRALWKEVHVTSGVWISAFLLFFLISGLTWTGTWGGKIVQPWNTFPANKWNDVPLSDKTHASLNHGALKEVPWTLEQTPLPASGSQAGSPGVPDGYPVNLNTVAALAKAQGFDGQFRVNLPSGEDGVYTISADSMDADTTNPFGDHTIHVDQYTGKILADIRYGDYPVVGKAMAVGIALHEATLGLWNLVLNTVYCLTIILMSISGIVMWWKRRPVGTLGAPLYPSQYQVPKAIIAIGAAVCALFPLTGIGVIIFAVIDFLLPKRLKEAGFQTQAAE